MTLASIRSETGVVRNTAARPGRTRTVEPGRTAARHLHYGRIILERGATCSVECGRLETGLASLKGEARIDADGRTFTLRPSDALYLPRDTCFTVAAGPNGCDLAEIAAPVEHRYPLRFVSFADVQRDPGLRFVDGGWMGR